MIYFLFGKLTFIEKNYIVINVHDVGYQVLVAKTSFFNIGEEILLYIYQIIKQDEQYLIGFRKIEEKELFLNLLKVKGLGPKSILNIFEFASYKEILNAIKFENVSFLKKIPGLGNKTIAQILLDLKGKYLIEETEDKKVYEEVNLALKQLGFKQAKIDQVLSSMTETNITSDELLKLALAKIRKN